MTISQISSLKGKLTIYALVFEKLKFIDIKALDYVNIGYLTNNITSDILRVHVFIVLAQNILNSPILMVIFTVILMVEVGVYSLVGVVMIFLLLGITILIGKLISKATQTKLHLSGIRNKETTFAFTGIKSIKFNCWESVINSKIQTLKKAENKSVFALNMLRTLSDGLNFVVPTIAAFITIVLYNSLEEQKLELKEIFFILATFNTLTSPLRLFYITYSNMEQVRVSFSRIQTVLDLPNSSETGDDSSLKCGEVKLDHCTSSYKESNFDGKIIDIINEPKAETLPVKGIP